MQLKYVELNYKLLGEIQINQVFCVVITYYNKTLLLFMHYFCKYRQVCPTIRQIRLQYNTKILLFRL